MIGMNRLTGTQMGGVDHVAQSISDILSTPIGSRLMRRDYGSLLPELVDQPQNAATLVRVYAAIASALMRWEPRVRISNLAMHNTVAGLIVDIEGEIADSEAVAMRIPLHLGGAS